jgi:hypothetical protein
VLSEQQNNPNFSVLTQNENAEKSYVSMSPKFWYCAAHDTPIKFNSESAVKAHEKSKQHVCSTRLAEMNPMEGLKYYIEITGRKMVKELFEHSWRDIRLTGEMLECIEVEESVCEGRINFQM